jgi:hypothetical protein
MDAALAARLELETLDRVGDVDFQPVDTGIVEDLVEHLAGRTNERLARNVLLIARLLTDENDAGVFGSFAEHGLGGVSP